MRQGRLGDFVDFAYGKALPERDRKPGSVPVFGSAGNIGSHHLPLVEGPGVIVGRKGTVGAVHWSNEDFYPIDTTFYIVPKEEDLRLRYIFYLLNALPLRHMNTDVAVPGLNRANALQLSVTIASSASQDYIVDVLSAYDDLVENNRRRIHLLEQMARLIYKEWFVHFRFPGREHTQIIDGVPEGWEKKPLGTMAPLKYGKALKNDHRIPGPFPVYGSSGIIGTHAKALVPGPTIIVGRKGNVGSVYWSPDDCHPIDTVYYIDSVHCSLFLFYTLQQMTFISTDVAVPGLNRDFAHSRSLLVADQKILRLFEDTVSPLHQQMELLERQNASLANARDLLLPKLMKGEVAV